MTKIKEDFRLRSALALTFAFATHAYAAPSLESEWSRARLMLPGIFLFTGSELKPHQTEFAVPELADPYVTLMMDSVVISGTAQYHLRFRTVRDIARGGPYQIVWNKFYEHDGTPLGEMRSDAHSWDMKPVVWPRLKVWYGGRTRPRAGNFSRDVFAYLEKSPGKWVSQKDSVFVSRGDWPRPAGSFLGHRYGHQIVMTSPGHAAVFFEEVTQTYENGGPKVTSIFMDQMANPLRAVGKPVELLSPLDPATGQAYPSALREDGAALVEGPLYFRFRFEGELWEAIGFSAGSFYGKYPSCFASRRVADGRKGKPYQLDLDDEGSDLNDAGRELGVLLNLAGGPGRPSVIVDRKGMAVPDSRGGLQILFHAYRREILPDHDYVAFPGKYGLNQMFRGLFHASLQIARVSGAGGLRFKIVPSQASVRVRPVQSLRGSGWSRIHAAAAKSKNARVRLAGKTPLGGRPAF